MKSTDLGVTLESHTVETGRGLMAGFLVRDAASRRDLGFIWMAGGAWRWQTPKATHYGERSTKAAAIETLRNAADVLSGATRRAPRLPFDDAPVPTDADILSAWRSVTPAAPRRAPVAPSAPPTPARRVVWDDAAPTPDITAAMASAFTKHGGKS